MAPLTTRQKASLQRDGYLVLERWLPKCWSRKLEQRLTFLSSKFPGRKALLPDPVFEDFCVSDEVLELARGVLGEDLLFHHANGRVLYPGAGGKPWHHDRDGAVLPPDERIGMYHFFFYPLGLCGSSGPLIVRPGTHLHEVPRDEPAQLRCTVSAADVSIVGGPGLTVVADSALWHMRPPLGGGRPRFDINLSFVASPGDWPERREYRSVLSEIGERRGEPWLHIARSCEDQP